MSQKILNPTETSLGTFNERPDRLLRRLRASARAVLILLLLVLVLFVLAGPYATTGWVGTYLVPVVVLFGVLVGSFALLAWGVLTLLKGGNKII